MSDEQEGIDLARLRAYGTEPPPPRRRFPPAAVKKAILAALAVGLVATPWIVVTRARNAPPRPIAPTPSPASPSPSPSPTATAVAEYVVRAQVCLRLRAAPKVGARVLRCLVPGATVRSRGETVQAGGRAWLRVYDPATKTSGWAAAEYLAPATASQPSPPPG
ncbi:MAG: SH3 domain-containing protein [Acidobacteria bacterium]|nr:SH3 domain-containing protein [Acidobacteriota bacterium]